MKEPVILSIEGWKEQRHRCRFSHFMANEPSTSLLSKADQFPGLVLPALAISSRDGLEKTSRCEIDGKQEGKMTKAHVRWLATSSEMNQGTMQVRGKAIDPRSDHERDKIRAESECENIDAVKMHVLRENIFRRRPYLPCLLIHPADSCQVRVSISHSSSLRVSLFLPSCSVRSPCFSPLDQKGALLSLLLMVPTLPTVVNHTRSQWTPLLVLVPGLLYARGALQLWRKTCLRPRGLWSGSSATITLVTRRTLASSRHHYLQNRGGSNINERVHPPTRPH